MKDETKTKQKPGQIISNNLWVLRIALRVCPIYIVMSIVNPVVRGLISFFSTTYMMQYIVNSIQEGRAFRDIIEFVITVLLVNVAASLALDFYTEVISPRYSTRYDAYFKKMVMEHAAASDLSSFDNPDFYNKYLLASSEGVGRCRNIINSVSGIAWNITSVVANCTLIASIDPILILFIVVPAIALVFQKKLNKVNFEKYKEQNACGRERDYAKRVFYMSEYTKELRVGNMASLLSRRFIDRSRDYIGIIKKYGVRIVLLNACRDASIDIIASSGAAAYSLYKTINLKTMLYGDCLVVLNSVSRMAWSLYVFLNNLMNFQDNSQYISNIREFLATAPKVCAPENPTPVPDGIHDIEFRGVSFRYDGAESDTINSLSLTIRAGERCALVGHNGAGKSTIVKLIMRFYDPTEGEILYDGINIREFDPTEWRERIGAVMQDFRLLSVTVAENILRRREGEGDRERVMAALRSAGAEDVISSLKDGAGTLMTKEFDEDGAVLSGGESQKVALARIFAGHFPLVILDEPSSALDPISEYEMYENMMAALEHSSAVIISHRLSSAVMADKIYLLEQGSVAECGSHAELMAAHGKYAEIFELQAKNYREEAQDHDEE